VCRSAPSGEQSAMAEYEPDVLAFFEKYSYETSVSEHFPTMEVGGLDVEEEITKAKALLFADMEMDDDAGVAMGKAFSAMKPENLLVISVTRNPMGDVGAAGMAAGLSDIPNLQSVIMMKCDFSDGALTAIAEKCKTASFDSLVMSTNKIGDAGLKAFAASVADGNSFQNLKKLYLDRNLITDEGAIALAEVLHLLPNLEYLALQKNKIGAKGLNAFSDAINKRGALSNAEYFWIQDQNVDPGEEAVEKLKKACMGKIKSYVSWPPPIPGFGYNWGKWGPEGRPLEEIQQIERDLLNPPVKGKGGKK